MELEQLKIWYSKYHDFWQQWKDYKFNGLDEKEILAIEVYRDNNFHLNTSWLELFNEREQITVQLITPLVLKLKENYDEYKEVVCIKFQFSLVFRALEYGWDEFYETPIHLLNIENELKEKLQLFRCKTIEDMERKFCNNEYKKEAVFVHVLKFKDQILVEFNVKNRTIKNSNFSNCMALI